MGMESDTESSSSSSSNLDSPSQFPFISQRPKKGCTEVFIKKEGASYNDNEMEGDDEISQEMTASYSEISFKSELTPEEEEAMLALNVEVAKLAQRPMSLYYQPTQTPFKPLNLEGTVHVEGNMTHFVTEDLETKIKLSSPVTRKEDMPSLPANSKSGTPNTLYRQLLMPQTGIFDPGLLNDLEFEARNLATSVDNLAESLGSILHSISSITADNVEIYKDAVAKMSDAMDANIKSMYTMMAKAEEVSKAMKMVQTHATRIKEIKRLVELFETYM